MPASLAYSKAAQQQDDDDDDDAGSSANPDPFILSPILNLPPSFGSAYVGETFSCTLCASHDLVNPGSDSASAHPRKTVRDVRIEAEMKTPNSAAGAIKLDVGPAPDPSDPESGAATGTGTGTASDLEPGTALQRIVEFDLKEEGSHVLAVTVSYYESTDVSGRTRTFRKLYQFVCKAALIVRTKSSPLGPLPLPGPLGRKGGRGRGRRWVLEAQLENCGEDAVMLERVVLDPEPGLRYTDCNYWEAGGGDETRPVLNPGEVEQICFVVEERATAGGGGDEGERQEEEKEEEAKKKGEGEGQGEDGGRTYLGVLGIGWRSEMGNRGFLSTGKLSSRNAR